MEWCLADEEDDAKEEGPFFIAVCWRFPFRATFSWCSFSAFSKVNSYLRHWFLIWSAQLSRESTLKQVEGVGMFVSLPVRASRDRGAAVWSFFLVLPTTYHSLSSFFASAKAAVKDFSKNGGARKKDPTGDFITLVLVAGMPIAGKTERKRVIWVDLGQDSRNLLLLTGRGKVTGLSALPLTTITHDDWHFLALSPPPPDSWGWRRKLCDLT